MKNWNKFFKTKFEPKILLKNLEDFSLQKIIVIFSITSSTKKNREKIFHETIFTAI